ncbi:MAG: proton-conducting transporter membrane subunit [Elusimicrobiales bacterium]|nr:proton-conducting transporter membrane subunit [Elusimicrobiales bacterium]
MISAAILLPAVAGAAALFGGKALARFLLKATACAHLALVLYMCVFPQRGGYWLALDGAGLLFLVLASVLFAAAAFYAMGYLDHSAAHREAHVLSPLFGTEPQPVFIAFLLFFLASMSFVCASRHLGLMWVALEATTLASVPLICFHKTPRSLEAAWKYLMICSVGIALALLGNFFLTAAVGAREVPLLYDVLRQNAAKLDPLWLKAAFAVTFIGYGTKMGLAPMHTWLPDAHSEAPSLVSALLSGALLNCAFLSMMRVNAVCAAAGLGAFSAKVFLAFGLLSVVVAAALMLRQRDYKRLLAYSSVENMGIIAVAAGAGAPYAAMLHAANHSFTKAALFLLSGNILRRFRSKKIEDVKGLAQALPKTSFLWAAGMLAILGMPPFGIFWSKFLTLKALLGSGGYWAAGLLLFMLAAVFAGVAHPVMEMLRPVEGQSAPEPEKAVFLFPALLLGLCTLLLGVFIPAPVEALLKSAAAALGGG